MNKESLMNKEVLGILLGAILGAVDGMTAWFYPEVRAQLAGIMVGSTVKGIIAGVAIGFFARKVNSLPLGILFGVAVGFLLAFIVAYLEHGHYFEDHPAWEHRGGYRRVCHVTVRRRAGGTGKPLNQFFQFSIREPVVKKGLLQFSMSGL